METTELLFKSQGVATWNQSLLNDFSAKSSLILKELHRKYPTDIMLAMETQHKDIRHKKRTVACMVLCGSVSSVRWSTMMKRRFKQGPPFTYMV